MTNCWNELAADNPSTSRPIAVGSSGSGNAKRTGCESRSSPTGDQLRPAHLAARLHPAARAAGMHVAFECQIQFFGDVHPDQRLVRARVEDK
jgi:hypothetical protein